jgi:hypothetical protein
MITKYSQGTEASNPFVDIPFLISPSSSSSPSPPESLVFRTELEFLTISIIITPWIRTQLPYFPASPLPLLS